MASDGGNALMQFGFFTAYFRSRLDPADAVRNESNDIRIGRLEMYRSEIPDCWRSCNDLLGVVEHDIW